MAIFGCIADDFTGASDAASFLVKGGLSVQLYNGIPTDTTPQSDAQALVVALKSRTQETAQAVEDTVSAAKWLLSQGVRQLYFKYCSTFDSTPNGNIGPVADALLELTGAPYSLLCPALPVNGRVVKEGCLYVDGVPLHESHMKNHPLTPMWDCRLSALMEPQSHYPCVELSAAALQALSTAPEGSVPAIENAPEAPFYLIPDYTDEEDGAAIAARFHALPLLTGGSGLLEPLARLWSAALGSDCHIPSSSTDGPAILLAGSCSKATLGQIACYQAAGKPSYKLDPQAMLEGRQSVDDAWDFVNAHSAAGDTVLVYSSDTPEKVKGYQTYGIETVAALLEGATAQLAVRAVQAGFTRIISAGGETSGAVTKALGFSSYLIGESVAPGVPLMVPFGRPDIRLVLKSGNFGQEDFFLRALAMTAKED